MEYALWRVEVEMPEEFTWVTRDGVGVVYPPRELDISNADQLRQCCQDAMVSARVVVDLSATRFLDSVALTVLVHVHRQLEAAGGWLRLAAGHGTMIQRVLQLTRLDDYLGNYPSVHKAIHDA